MPENFNMYTKEWSVATIHKMYHKKIPQLNFESAMQRGEVWSKQKSSLYIHSVLMDLTEYQQPFLVSKEVDENGKITYDVLDGKQRGLKTLIRYLNGEYALSGLKREPKIMLDGEEYDPSGKRFKQLPAELQQKIKDTTIKVAVMENATPELKALIFRRFNGGKSMTGFDLARSYKLDMSDILELSNHGIFEAMFSESRRQSLPQHEIIVKTYISLFDDEPCYGMSYITRYMENLYIDDEHRQQISETYDKVLAAYKVLLLEDKASATKMFDKTYFYIYLSFTDRFDTPDQFAEWFKILLKSEEYKAVVSEGHTTTPKYVKARLNLVEKLINEYLGSNGNE